MMKNLLVILVSLMMIVSFATAETFEPASVTVSFDANMTTGYAWTGFVLGGESVELANTEAAYVSDPNPDMLDGVGGTATFTLVPVKAGESIVVFTYGRPWEEDIADRQVVLASVDEQLNVTLMDVTESGVIEGTVISVDEEDHSVLLNAAVQGEIIARFDEDMALPVPDEHIVIYTNGTMTMSLPAIMNVIAWESVPGEEARGMEAYEPDLAAQAVEGGWLTGVRYASCGDENGNTYLADIARTEDLTLVLKVEESEAHNLPLTISRYSAEDDTLARIADIVNANGMQAWADREDAYFVCDAAHPYLTLEIMAADGERRDVSISGFIEMSSEESAAFRSVLDVLFENENAEHLLEQYQQANN